MEIVLAYLAGLLTLINPCVLPVLPIVLGSALQASPRGPLALAGGMALSFTVLGMIVAAAGFALGLSEESVARAGAVLMLLFGLVLLVPRASAVFAGATGGIAAGADARIRGIEGTGAATGAGGQFLGGLLLGAVWSPCVGPVLGGAIALAASGQDLGHAALIMAAFAAGVGTLILGLGYGARGLLLRHRGGMQALARLARPALGVMFILVGTAILFRLHHLAEAWALRVLPPWLTELSVAF